MRRQLSRTSSQTKPHFKPYNSATFFNYASPLKGSRDGATNNGLTTAEAREKASRMKQDLLNALEALGDKLPSNTLDELIDSLGGTDCVAEVCAGNIVLCVNYWQYGKILSVAELFTAGMPRKFREVFAFDISCTRCIQR